MTTISNITIVVQQGDAARDSQQMKQVLDPRQMTPAQQAHKEMEQRAVVGESDNADKNKPYQEKRRDEKQEQEKEQKEKEKKAIDEEDPDGTGRLLDTIA